MGTASSSADAAAALHPSGVSSGFYGLCPLLGPFCFGRAAGWVRTTVAAIADSASLVQSCVNVSVFPWLLAILLLLWIAFMAFWLGMRSADRMTLQEAGFSRHFLPSRRSWWYTFNVIALVLVVSYAVFLIIELTGAAGTTVGLTVTSGEISMDCTGNVALGTLEQSGDTGAFDPMRSATCTIYALNPAGYTLTWRNDGGNGRTTTGTLLTDSGQTIDQYAPVVTGTPETWQVASGLSAWGGRLSSDSTTADASVWGTDGADEKWLNVATGSYVLIERTSATGLTPDIETIGFRVEVKAPLALTPGTYSAPLYLTATEN